MNQSHRCDVRNSPKSCPSGGSLQDVGALWAYTAVQQNPKKWRPAEQGDCLYQQAQVATSGAATQLGSCVVEACYSCNHPGFISGQASQSEEERGPADARLKPTFPLLGQGGEGEVCMTFDFLNPPEVPPCPRGDACRSQHAMQSQTEEQEHQDLLVGHNGMHEQKRIEYEEEACQSCCGPVQQRCRKEIKGHSGERTDEAHQITYEQGVA